MSTTPNELDFEVDFDIDDTDPHNLFTSPDKKHQTKASSGANGAPIEPTEDIRGRAKDRESRQSAEESREAALRQELENVRKINEVLEGVYSSLEKAKNNMEVIDCHAACDTVPYLIGDSRQSPEPSPMHPPFYNPGPAS